MKNTFLITASVAALVAGIGLASAQGLNEHRDAPAAATSEQKAPEGQTDHQKSTRAILMAARTRAAAGIFER